MLVQNAAGITNINIYSADISDLNAEWNPSLSVLTAIIDPNGSTN